MSTVDLDKAFGTKEAAAKFGMKEDEVTRYIGRFPHLRPQSFAGRYVWTDADVETFAEHVAEGMAKKTRVAEARKTQTCLHCGGKPFDPEGTPTQTKAERINDAAGGGE